MSPTTEVLFLGAAGVREAARAGVPAESAGMATRQTRPMAAKMPFPYPKAPKARGRVH